MALLPGCGVRDRLSELGSQVEDIYEDSKGAAENALWNRLDKLNAQTSAADKDKQEITEALMNALSANDAPLS
jgi:hypothetical protein